MRAHVCLSSAESGRDHASTSSNRLTVCDSGQLACAPASSAHFSCLPLLSTTSLQGESWPERPVSALLFPSSRKNAHSGNWNYLLRIVAGRLVSSPAWIPGLFMAGTAAIPSPLLDQTSAIGTYKQVLRPFKAWECRVLPTPPRAATTSASPSDFVWPTKKERNTHIA